MLRDAPENERRERNAAEPWHRRGRFRIARTLKRQVPVARCEVDRIGVMRPRSRLARHSAAARQRRGPMIGRGVPSVIPVRVIPVRVIPVRVTVTTIEMKMRPTPVIAGRSVSPMRVVNAIAHPDQRDQ